MSRALLKFDDDGNLTQAGYDPKDAYAFTVIAWPVVFDENFISGDKRTFTFDSDAWGGGPQHHRPVLA